MTIRMLQAWNGLHQQKIVTTLSGSDEASLVAAGIATYDLDGPAENVRMAQLATDAGGNSAKLRLGASRIFATPDYIAPADLNFQNVRLVTMPKAINPPTPYGPGTEANLTAECTHPGMVYEKNGWQGYRYWMAYTPYPGADSTYENPCICASNDGENFELPAGAPNPLFPKPVEATGYNSDTHLFLMPDKSKLILIWRARGISISGTNYNVLYVTESTDGRNWTAPVNIWQGVVGSSDMAAPSLWHDGTNWNIVAHNLDVGGYPVRYMQSANLYSGWPGTPSTLTITHPTGGTWWHSFWVRLSSGKIAALIQDGNSGGGGLFWVETPDMTTFQVGPLNFGKIGFYRSSFVIEQADNGDYWLRMFTSRISGGFYIRMGLARFDRDDWQRRQLASFAGIVSGQAAGIAGYIGADTFNRADSATSLGNATSGQTYTQDTGPTNVIGISSKRAYNATSANCRALVNMGVSDFVYSLRVISVGSGSQVWAIVRASGSTNYWRIGVAGGAWTAQKIVSGAFGDTNVTTLAYFADNDILRIVCNGNKITAYVNDMEIWSKIDTFNNTATQVGFQMSGNTSYVDRLSVVAV